MNTLEDDDLQLQLAYFDYVADQDRLQLRSCSWPGVAAMGAELSRSGRGGAALGLDVDMLRHVAKTGETIHLRDCQQAGQWVNGVSARSLCVLPVSAIGPCDVLVIGSSSIDGISRRERALARALVRHVAQPGESIAACEARMARLERGLRRIRLEISQLSVEGENGGDGYPQGMADRLRLLSPREWQVMERLRSGRRVPTIAGELTISPNTVRNHLKSIYRKLGVRSQVELLERMRGPEPAVPAIA